MARNANMTLCHLCRDITPYSFLPIHSSKPFQHHPTFRLLQDSAQTCKLCKLLQYVLSHELDLNVTESRTHDSLPQTALPIPATELDPVILHIPGGFVQDFGWSSTATRDNFVYLTVKCGSRLEGLVHVFAEPGDTQSFPTVSGRRIHDPGSPACARKIQGWLRKCQSEHMCSNILESSPVPQPTQRAPISFQAPFLPKRLLDINAIGHSGAIRLVENVGRKDPYIALSHRWGTSRHLTTTELSLKAHMANIDIDLLPRTFQDAVEITRNLGIRYLWIDSLCILQDNKIDWETESSVMDRIYNSAYLTIAASNAESDNSGFLVSRTKPSIEPVELQYREEGSQHIQKWWFAIAGNLEGRAQDNVRQGVDHSTLNSRAWVLQERLLSPRVVHFTKTQIVWVSVILKSIAVKVALIPWKGVPRGDALRGRQYMWTEPLPT